MFGWKIGSPSSFFLRVPKKQSFFGQDQDFQKSLIKEVASAGKKSFFCPCPPSFFLRKKDKEEGSSKKERLGAFVFGGVVSPLSNSDQSKSAGSFPRTILRVSLGEEPFGGSKVEKGQSFSSNPSSSNPSSSNPSSSNPLIGKNEGFTDFPSSPFQSQSSFQPSSQSTFNQKSEIFEKVGKGTAKEVGAGSKANVGKGVGSQWVRSSRIPDNKGEVVSITYEEIGLFPRSFSRVLDRFLKQVFSDVENLVVREYRFYRYLFLTTLKCLLILFFVPFFVNWIAKTYVVRPLTEYFWNGKQTEIFLNSYQQKRAFRELKDFEEKLYFESLVYPKTAFSKEKQGSQKSEILEANFLKTLPSALPNNSVTEVKEWEGVIPYQKSLIFEGSQKSKIFEEVEFAGSSTRTSSTSAEAGFGYSITDLSSVSQPSSQSISNQKSEILEGTLISNPSKTQSFQDRLETGNVGYSGRSKGREDEKTESLINSYTLKSSLFVYQTIEADKNIQQRYQEKTIELAQRYNDQSIEAITNFFADLISLLTLFYLLYALEIQINITKSFLLEVFFGLDDSKKSLLILLVTDLLVGYHSSNLWELFFEFLFHHYGLPESQTGIFLLVATLPVLLDVLFKYLIFRHLNRSSPATVATYHAMIE